MRSLPDAVGLDVLPGPHTDVIGSVEDRRVLRRALGGVDAVIHTATLHKPHVATHAKDAFVAVNVRGTLAVLEEAAAAHVGSVVFTSTTSAFGRALRPGPGRPAAWIDESVRPVPRNVYGATKVAAEDLCELVHRDTGLPVVVLRVARFFPEPDDDPAVAAAWDPVNLQVNELLHRRVDLADVVTAHLLALERGPDLGFDRFVVSAPTPLRPADLDEISSDAAAVVARRCPGAADAYAALGWRLPRTLDRVYDSSRARDLLGWRPDHDFAAALARRLGGGDHRSDLAVAIGSRGYHRT